MKQKTCIFLALVLSAATVPFLLAQDATSNSSTIPSSQSTAASSQTSTGNDSAAVSSKSSSSDGDLTQQLQSKFSQDPAFANVQVSVTNHTAMLTGTVVSKADKKRAKEMAKSVAGIKKVDEHLTVSATAGGSAPANNNPTSASTSTGTSSK